MIDGARPTKEEQMTAVKESLGHSARKITEALPGFTPTPRHPSRAVAGLLLAAHRHAEFELLKRSGLIRVPSASEPGLVYTVDLSGQGVCSCPFWRFGDAFDGHRAVDKHLVAAEFVVAFRRSTPGVRFEVERRHDSRFGLTTFDVVERSEEFPAGRCWSTALNLEGALLEVVELMQDRIQEAG
jgi:hypothetical protein